MRDNVVIATPLTLFALLRTIIYGWRQERLAENAVKIARTGRELYDRIGNMAETYLSLGQAIRRSATIYNQALGQMERMVLSSARKLKEHDAAGIKEIPEVEPIDIIERNFSAPEFQIPAEE
jgi:DNA recombination protein RmuC